MEHTYEKNWMTQEEAAAFAGKNAAFYLEKWKSHSDTSLKGWNWAAMFFGIEWMAYRKMYREVALVFILNLCIAGVGVFLPDFIGELLGNCIRILFGVFGNMFYRRKALRVLRKIDTQNETERLLELSRRGGVSPVSVIVLVVLELVYFLCLYALMAIV